MDKLKTGESISNGKLHIKESVTVENKTVAEPKLIVTEAVKDGKKTVLKPRISAIHAGRTRNNNIYPSEKLRGDISFKSENGEFKPTGVYSFTKPYPKPMIIDHMPAADNVTGRITNAQFIKDTATNVESIIIIPEITSTDAIEKILDGRYLTVSVGVETDSARCNICGKDIIEQGWCEHEKGVDYEGTICGWILGNIWFDECSWVAVPADPNAQVQLPGEVTAMEAYVGVENEYFDVSCTKSTLTESAIESLGLKQEEKMNQEEGGQTQLDELNEKINSLTEEVNKLNTANTELTESLNKVTAEKSELEVKLAETEAKATAAESKVTELETEKAALTAEKEALIQKESDASANAHKKMAEQVVSMKVALGKIASDETESAITVHTERSFDSLNDTYKDLMSELLINKKKSYIPEKLHNPGASAIEGEMNAVIEGSETKPADPKAITQTILRNLLTGEYKHE